MAEFYESYYENIRIIGITASIKNYHICWLINNIKNYDFKLIKDQEFALERKNRQYYFKIYQYTDYQNNMVNLLYHNFNDGEYLLPEYRNFNYLWVLKSDEINKQLVNETMDSLRKIRQVQIATELNKNKIINKGNLLFE